MNDPKPNLILLDPTNESRPSVREKSARLDSVAGKRLGLLDISKARGNVFLDELESLLRARGAEVTRFTKPTFTKPAPIDLRHEIATHCEAVIEALAD